MVFAILCYMAETLDESWPNRDPDLCGMCGAMAISHRLLRNLRPQPHWSAFGGACMTQTNVCKSSVRHSTTTSVGILLVGFHATLINRPCLLS